MNTMRLNPLFQPFLHLNGPRLESLYGADDGGGFCAISSVERDENGLHVRAVLPGVAPERLEIEVEGRWLTLRGTRAPDASEEDATPTFTRRLQMPFAIDGEASTAHLEHGVLTLSLPRPAADAPRRIAVTLGAAQIADKAS